MNCLDSLDLLQRRLDGEPLPGPSAPGSALEEHLAQCESCRRDHAAGSLMLEGLKLLPRAAELPADFTRQLVGSILQDRHKRQARMRRRVWVTCALAAAILLAVWAGNIWLPQPKQAHGPEQNIAQKTPPEKPSPAPEAPKQLAEHKVPEETVPSLSQSVNEVRQDVLALTSRLANDQVRLFTAMAPSEIPAFPRETRLPMDEPLDPAAQSLRQAGQGVTEGLNTVSRNARKAVQFFMKELPVLDAQ